MVLAPISGTPARRGVTRWAVGLAVAVVVALAGSYAIFAVARAIGGAEAVEDTWVGYLGGVALLGGLAASLAAFVLAVVAKAEHERWALLRLPLVLFPALIAIVVLAEMLWIE